MRRFIPSLSHGLVVVTDYELGLECQIAIDGKVVTTSNAHMVDGQLVIDGHNIVLTDDQQETVKLFFDYLTAKRALEDSLWPRSAGLGKPLFNHTQRQSD